MIERQVIATLKMWLGGNLLRRSSRKKRKQASNATNYHKPSRKNDKRSGNNNDLLNYDTVYEDETADEDANLSIQSPLAIGYELPIVVDISEALAMAGEQETNFICVPLYHPRYRHHRNANCDSRGQSKEPTYQTRSELLLDYDDWASYIIGKTSPWIQLSIAHDTQDPRVFESEQAFFKEYSYANHLGLQAVIVPFLEGSALHANRLSHLTNFARVLSTVIQQYSATSPQLWVRLPLSIPSADHSSRSGWDAWNELRYMVDHSPRVFIALEMPQNPSAIEDIFSSDNSNTIGVWAGEPVKAIILPTALFRVSSSGRTMHLSSLTLRRVLHKFFQHKMHVIVKGEILEGLTLRHYIRCLENLHTKYGADGRLIRSRVPPSLCDQFSFPYRDSLRGPLDPLQDNLDSNTYRIMEQDPVKYERYEASLIAALKEIKLHRGNSSKSPEPVSILVVGPGRGPLIESSLLAAAVTQVVVQITAVEKNDNAVITLRNRFRGRPVSIIHGDMRKLINETEKSVIPIKSVDVIVSELLGSWGDNEASPECLQYVRIALKDTGVMIPQRYTSYLAPLCSSKLWMDAREMYGSMPTSDHRRGLDCPYVVCLHSCHILAEAKPVFEFVHPDYTYNPQENLSNSGIFSTMKFCEFEVKESSTIHGFAGYFDCTLYKDIGFSTVPHMASEGMFSWFPMFIPVEKPFTVKEGESVKVTLWRCVNSNKMWYEWIVTGPVTQRVQNSFGQSFCVRL